MVKHVRVLIPEWDAAADPNAWRDVGRVSIASLGPRDALIGLETADLVARLERDGFYRAPHVLVLACDLRLA